MIPFMLLIGGTFAGVAAYSFGWYARGRYEQPYIDQMKGGLIGAAWTFNDYAQQHRAKGTPEGDAKAAVNSARATAALEMARRP